MRHGAGLGIGTLLAIVGSFGCGDGGGAGSNDACEAVPCGGDLVGTWQVRELCRPPFAIDSPVPQDVSAQCPGFRDDPVEAEVSGTFTFAADGAYAHLITLSLTKSSSLPASCLPSANCADLDAALKQAQAENPEPAIAAIGCSGGSTCTCTLVSITQTIDDAGTYTASGTTLTTLPEGVLTPEVTEYCVQGDTAVFRMGGAGAAGLTFVATR